MLHLRPAHSNKSKVVSEQHDRKLCQIISVLISMLPIHAKQGQQSIATCIKQCEPARQQVSGNEKAAAAVHHAGCFSNSSK
jgi:hypothetical protein